MRSGALLGARASARPCSRPCAGRLQPRAQAGNSKQPGSPSAPPAGDGRGFQRVRRRQRGAGGAPRPDITPSQPQETLPRRVDHSTLWLPPPQWRNVLQHTEYISQASDGEAMVALSMLRIFRAEPATELERKVSAMLRQASATEIELCRVLLYLRGVWLFDNGINDEYFAAAAVYMCLTQERLDIVRRGAMGGGQLGREQADFWFDLLLEHEESIADILMEAFRAESVPSDGLNRLRQRTRAWASVVARFLACFTAVAQLKGNTLAALAELLYLADNMGSPSDEWLELVTAAPQLTQPMSPELAWAATDIAQCGVVPLLCYAECQRWLQCNEGGTDVSDQFWDALPPFINIQTMLLNSLPMSLPGRQLLFRAHAAAAFSDTETSDAAPTAGGLSGFVGAALRRMLPSSPEKLLGKAAVESSRFAFKKVFPEVEPRTQGEWVQEVRALLARAADLLRQGDPAGAEALVKDHAALLQEPALVTVFIAAPTWEEVGGPQLEEAALQSGGIVTLMNIASTVDRGPVLVNLRWSETLQCGINAGQWANVEELLSYAVADLSGPYKGRSMGRDCAWDVPEPWHVLGNACAGIAAAGEQRLGTLQSVLRYTLALPRLLEGQRLPVHPAALQLVAGRALEQLRADCPAALPALAAALADTGWLEEQVTAAFRALLDAGMAAEAVQELGHILQRQQEEAGSEQGTLPALLAAALLDHPAGGAERLAQALQGQDTPAAGAAARLLARELLQRGLSPAAWQLLFACPPAAHVADRAAFVALCKDILAPRSAKLLEATADLVQTYDATQLRATGGAELQRWAALALARSGRAEQALALGEGLPATVLSEVAAALLQSGAGVPPQAAERLLAACAATQGCGRTAAAYYQQLLDSGAAVPASVHANGLLGLLDSIHGTDSTEAATAAAAAAVSLLEQRYTDLSTLHAGLLDAQVLGAAAHALQRQTSSRGSMTAYRAAAAVQASSVSSKEAAEQLYSSLEPPAQLAAWGLRLAAAVDRSSKDDATLQQVVGGVSSTMRHTGGQLLALLRLLPLWLPDFRPSSPDWGDALAAARRQLGSGSLSSEDARLVAQQVAAIGSELRQQAGDDWPTSLPTPALVALLLAGERLGDTGLMLEAFEALQNKSGIPQEDAPALNRCYSALLATCFASAAGTSQQGSPAAPDLALCTRVWEGWQRQLQLAKGRAEPESPEAAEASAVTVLLGQRQYNAGWKLLGEVAEQWGGPPSPTTLLCVLRGLEQQLEQGELPHDVLRAAARAAADLGQQAPQAQQAQQADAAPARWPPLDSDLAAAVLRLLRRSAAAADADPQPGADSGADVLLEGGRSLLLGLAAAGQPVEAGLCEELFESFSQQAALEQWAVEAFGSAVVARVNRQVVEGIGAPLVLRPLSSSAGQRAQKAEQQQPAQPEAVDGSDSSSGSPRKRAKRASADEGEQQEEATDGQKQRVVAAAKPAGAVLRISFKGEHEQEDAALVQQTAQEPALPLPAAEEAGTGSQAAGSSTPEQGRAAASKHGQSARSGKPEPGRAAASKRGQSDRSGQGPRARGQAAAKEAPQPAAAQTGDSPPPGGRREREPSALHRQAAAAASAAAADGRPAGGMQPARSKPSSRAEGGSIKERREPKPTAAATDSKQAASSRPRRGQQAGRAAEPGQKPLAAAAERVTSQESASPKEHASPALRKGAKGAPLVRRRVKAMSSKELAAEAKRLGLRPGRGGKWASDYELRGLVLAALLLEES